MSQQNYYRKTVTVTFYAENPEVLEQSVEGLAQEAVTGEIVADAGDQKTETISPLEAAYGLIRAGSEPRFFMDLPDPELINENPEVEECIVALARCDIETPEFDEALGRLQAIIGVNSGDLAAQFFSGMDWANMAANVRRDKVRGYIGAEQSHADSAVSR
ncbi:hypothetical protein TK90_2627 (plasmid) [Thioalkalivibrio sp. K90mix]|uniref:hypothetical protein n=1 Tax=Thioalkalivibrio sp. (strain K90mix) TaxID=396595 RepID=UPI000195AB8F|nr:hypothetical protein [Thioalkalivibrio sp. K90mix]ADC73114.1 hypothetical protein TK90_2627 [Thioalkalivibrio sp. K90mix]